MGKFKDETGGRKITDFVGLKPKMYSYTIEGEANQNAHHRAKGISTSTSSKMTHQDYLNQLELPTETLLVNRRIAHNLQKIHSLEVQKRGLCAFDDKRFLLEDGTTLCNMVK